MIKIDVHQTAVEIVGRHPSLFLPEPKGRGDVGLVNG
jgi:hypothetical protein